MKKRLISLVLCICMISGVLSGCGSSKETDIAADNVQEDNAENDNQGVSSEKLDRPLYYNSSLEPADDADPLGYRALFYTNDGEPCIGQVKCGNLLIRLSGDWCLFERGGLENWVEVQDMSEEEVKVCYSLLKEAKDCEAINDIKIAYLQAFVTILSEGGTLEDFNKEKSSIEETYASLYNINSAETYNLQYKGVLYSLDDNLLKRMSNEKMFDTTAVYVSSNEYINIKNMMLDCTEVTNSNKRTIAYMNCADYCELFFEDTDLSPLRFETTAESEYIRAYYEIIKDDYTDNVALIKTDDVEIPYLVNVKSQDFYLREMKIYSYKDGVAHLCNTIFENIDGEYPSITLTPNNQMFISYYLKDYNGYDKYYGYDVWEYQDGKFVKTDYKYGLFSEERANLNTIYRDNIWFNSDGTEIAEEDFHSWYDDFRDGTIGFSSLEYAFDNIVYWYSSESSDNNVVEESTDEMAVFEDPAVSEMLDAYRNAGLFLGNTVAFIKVPNSETPYIISAEDSRIYHYVDGKVKGIGALSYGEIAELYVTSDDKLFVVASKGKSEIEKSVIEWRNDEFVKLASVSLLNVEKDYGTVTYYYDTTEYARKDITETKYLDFDSSYDKKIEIPLYDNFKTAYLNMFISE